MRKIFVLVLAVPLFGCSAQERKPLLVGWSFTGGAYEDVLREVFGDGPARSGVNFYVLPNAWAPIEPNGLAFTQDIVYYIETIDGVRHSFEVEVEKCSDLNRAVTKFFDELALLVPYSMGDKEYPDPGYLDGPDYVIEVHGDAANLVIDPTGFSWNFPLVQSAWQITKSTKACDDS